MIEQREDDTEIIGAGTLQTPLKALPERLSPSFALLGAIVLFSSPVRADNADPKESLNGRVTIVEENDKFTASGDKHYTQGMRVSFLSEPVTSADWWNRPYEWLNGNLPVFDGLNRKRKYEWTIIGQSLFTPSDTETTSLSLQDRPYAAWLYTGIGLLQETDHESHTTLENAELLFGVVGAAALGALTQNDFHQFIDVPPALGWKNQLKTEPGFVATYERKWRFQKTLTGNFAADAIPELGASVGNILTYGEAGGMVRLGQNIEADYGPNRIRPSLSGTGWFDDDRLNGTLGWYIFAGVQNRIVGRNIFLDGNSFTHSPSVGKKTFVTDFIGGASLFWSLRVRVDFTVTQRTKEFYGQQGQDRFGGINLAFQF